MKNRQQQSLGQLRGASWDSVQWGLARAGERALAGVVMHER